jgi:hypothetical protein
MLPPEKLSGRDCAHTYIESIAQGPANLRCHTQPPANFCGVRQLLEQTIVAAEYLVSTAKAFPMPMPGALDDGSDPERKRDPCHLPETPSRHTRSLPENGQTSGVAKA